MIRRFLCLLLVPLMLVNQAMCFAHSHHGTDIAEPEGHASRPHFHFGDHGHHDSNRDHKHHAKQSHGEHFGHHPRSDEHDAAFPLEITSVSDHDANAVYFTETVTIARDGNSVVVLSSKYVTVAAILRVAEPSDDWSLRLGQPASVFDTACPIYLRTLSLRI